MKLERIFVGVDPGKKGAIAILHEGGTPRIFPMPLLVGATKSYIDKATGKRRTRKLATDRYDINMIAKFFLRLTERANAIHVCYEELVTLPSQIVRKGKKVEAGGGKANFGRGFAMGMLESFFVLLGSQYPGITFQSVKPNTWMKAIHGDLGGSDPKIKSILIARRLFPRTSLKRTPKSKKDDDGIADALLIAEYGRRTFTGTS
jgi:hypothetical protein